MPGNSGSSRTSRPISTAISADLAQYAGDVARLSRRSQRSRRAVGRHASDSTQRSSHVTNCLRSGTRHTKDRGRHDQSRARGTFRTGEHRPRGPVACWLAGTELTEIRRAVHDPADALFDRLARQAIAWPDVDTMLRNIRGRLHRGDPRTMTITLSAHNEGRQAALRAAQSLALVGYVIAPRLEGRRLRLTPNRRGEASRRRLLQFLGGQWLEAGTRGVAEQIFRQAADIEVVANLELHNRDGRHFELDLVGGRAGVSDRGRVQGWQTPRGAPPALASGTSATLSGSQEGTLSTWPPA